MAEFRPGSFNMIPPVIKNLVIINALVFFAQMTFGNSSAFNIDNLFALHDIHSVYFKPYQVITYMFLHGGFQHIFFNMFALWMFGSVLENLWGAKRFLIFYIACGVGAAILHLVILYYEMAPIMEYVRHSFSFEQQQELIYSDRFKVNVGTVGASGAIFGCLAAFAYLFPNSYIYLYFFFPIKVKWFVLLYAGMELYLGVANSAGDNVAHWAHLGGALVGFVMVWYWNRTNRRTFY